MKKLLAIVISMAMVLAMLPVGVFAETDNCVAEIGDQPYTTLQSAIDAATVGETIKLVKDISEVSVKGPKDKMITIDLNGYHLTGSIIKDHDLAITDSSEKNKGTAEFTYVQCNVLYLNGGTIAINDAQINHAVRVDGGNVTINGGEYKLGGGHSNSITVETDNNGDNNGILTINAGLFWTDISNLLDINHQAIKCTIVVYESPSVERQQEVFTVGAKEQGNFTIKKTTSGGESLYFYDLYTAAKAASDNDTITLLGAQIINRSVDIDKTITIDGNNQEVKIKEQLIGFGAYGNIAHGVFSISGSGKTATIRNVKFSDSTFNSILIRAYNKASNSTCIVDNCTFKNIEAMNVIRAASGSASNAKLIARNCVFESCKSSEGGIIQIDSGSNNATSEIISNDFINNEIKKPTGDNVAVIYLSAPGTVKGNYFEGNNTTEKSDKKNGIIVTGFMAGGSTIDGNAFVTHTFTEGKGKGAVYGAKGGTIVSNNYYGSDITHLVEAENGFTEGNVATMYYKNSGAGVTTGNGGAYVPPTDNVTNNTTDKNTTADLNPAVSDNKANTTVDADTAAKIVDKAVANKSTEVIIDAAAGNNVAASEVGIPEATVKELSEKTDANLVIKTDNGKVDLDKTALDAVAAQAGTTGTVKLIVETVKTDANICHVDLKLVTSNGNVTDFKGGNVKVTVSLNKELAGKELVCVYINDNGIYTKVDGVLNADGTYTFTTGHFSEYAVMAKDEADKAIADQLNTLIKEVSLTARTSKTAKKNIKVTVNGDVTALKDAGYTVKYKFYRSTKKASKYTAKVTKDTNTYINTKGKKGTKYYYKAKVLVYDEDTLVAQTALKQCKYGARFWTK